MTTTVDSGENADVELRYAADDRRSDLGTRPLRPLDLVPADTLEHDLDRRYVVLDRQQARDVSPLDLVLGAVDAQSKDSPTRLLALGVGAGLDWLGSRRRSETGDEFTGHEIVKLTVAGLQRRDDDVFKLLAICDALEAPVTWDEMGAAIDACRALFGNVNPDAVVAVEPPKNNKFSFRPAAHYYRSDDLISLAAMELWLRAMDGVQLPRCPYCGARFVPHERADQVYCLRAAPGEPAQGRTCRQLGPQRLYTRTAGPHELLYRRTYKRLDQRARRGSLQRDDLDRWRVAARELVARAERRDWTVERLEQELDRIEPKG